MQILGFRCKYNVGSVSDVVRSADFAIVASGSTTLQVAGAGCPMVIMYQSSKMLWQLVGRWLIKTNFLSLVNILAKKELVPEFMPCFSSVEPIVQAIERLLEDRAALAEVSSRLIKLTEPLGKNKASKKVAEIATEMLTL